MTHKHTTCPNCRARIPVSTGAPDRGTYERENGEFLTVTCPECGTVSNVHINKVTARPNHLVTYIVTAAFTLFWIVFFLSGAFTNIFALLLSTSMIGIPALVKKAVDRQADTFNEYKLYPPTSKTELPSRQIFDQCPSSPPPSSSTSTAPSSTT